MTLDSLTDGELRRRLTQRGYHPHLVETLIVGRRRHNRRAITRILRILRW